MSEFYSLDEGIERRNAAFANTYGPNAVADYLEGTLRTRADAFAAHVMSMTINPAVAVWALAMSAKFGDYVQVHHFIADWITALLIVRYGEEPDNTKTIDGTGWPTSFTANDMTRAQELLAGVAWPTSLTLLTRAADPTTTED